MEEITRVLTDILGDDPKHFTVWQTALRAFVVYITMLIVVRIGHKRFMGRNTAFDIVLGYVLGSVVSRAINGQASFIPTLSAAAVLVAMHYIFSWGGYRSEWFNNLIKGDQHKLIDNGKINEEQLARHHITTDDLRGSLRLHASISKFEDTQEAYLENSGEISGIKRQSQPVVKEIKVENGVQTIRIELGSG